MKNILFNNTDSGKNLALLSGVVGFAPLFFLILHYELPRPIKKS